jgi:hypothetical protein
MAVWRGCRCAQADPLLEATLAEHRALRGASLVERHQQSLAAQGKVPRGGRAAAPFSFDHDDMMGASQRVTAHDLNGMIADAKSLDTKFSRSVTRNFM